MKIKSNFGIINWDKCSQCAPFVAIHFAKLFEQFSCTRNNIFWSLVFRMQLKCLNNFSKCMESNETHFEHLPQLIITNKVRFNFHIRIIFKSICFTTTSDKKCPWYVSLMMFIKPYGFWIKSICFMIYNERQKAFSFKSHDKSWKTRHTIFDVKKWASPTAWSCLKLK